MYFDGGNLFIEVGGVPLFHGDRARAVPAGAKISTSFALRFFGTLGNFAASLLLACLVGPPFPRPSPHARRQRARAKSPELRSRWFVECIVGGKGVDGHGHGRGASEVERT